MTKGDLKMLIMLRRLILVFAVYLALQGAFEIFATKFGAPGYGNLWAALAVSFLAMPSIIKRVN